MTELTKEEAQALLSAAWAADTDRWTEEHQAALKTAELKLGELAFDNTNTGGTK